MSVVVRHERRGGFPRYGKFAGHFSTPWKTFFHGMENRGVFFPWYGKSGADFSTLWKTFFHAVEKRGGGECARCVNREGGICEF